MYKYSVFYSILLYSVLFCSILFFSVLFYSILSYSILCILCYYILILSYSVVIYSSDYILILFYLVLLYSYSVILSFIIFLFYHIPLFSIPLIDKTNCRTCDQIVAELEKIDDDCDSYGIQLVKLKDPQLAKRYQAVFRIRSVSARIRNTALISGPLLCESYQSYVIRNYTYEHLNSAAAKRYPKPQLSNSDVFRT